LSAVPLPLLSWLAILLAGWGHDTERTVVRAARASAVVEHLATVTRRRPRFVFDASPLTGAQRARTPIRRIRLVDDYGGSDYASIAADNTSAFNCRNVTGGSG
jgi:hypothetical protein